MAAVPVRASAIGSCAARASAAATDPASISTVGAIKSRIGRATEVVQEGHPGDTTQPTWVPAGVGHFVFQRVYKSRLHGCRRNAVGEGVSPAFALRATAPRASADKSRAVPR